MSTQFQYTIANCEPNHILKIMVKLSNQILDATSQSISADKLAVRFMVQEQYIDTSTDTLDMLHFGETVLDSLQVFATFFRGKLKLDELEVDYLRQLCFEVAKKLKSDGVVKISGSSLFSMLSKAMGFKSHQSMESALDARKPAMPQFKTVEFTQEGQDFKEFITMDGLIVDCQPYQAEVWCGLRGSILPFSNQFRLIRGRYISPEQFDTLKHYEESQFISYEATPRDTPLAYKQGFMSFLRGDGKPDRKTAPKEFVYGYNAAAWNYSRSQDFKDLVDTKYR